MTLYTDDRPHPIPGMVANPEREIALTKRAELYIAKRKRRAEPECDPEREAGIGLSGVILAVVAAVLVGVSLVGGML